MTLDSSGVSEDFPLSVLHVIPIYACYSIYTQCLCKLELCMFQWGYIIDVLKSVQK